MRLVFFGTPRFAVPILESLISGKHEVAAVVTQPDRPRGRKLVLTPPPAKRFALERRLAVLQPEKIKSPDFLQQMRELAPDLIIVAAFGQIFPKALLDLPRHGCWNVHASLLPKYRGASPIQRCLMAGEKETGISIMQMGVGLDDGDVLSTKRLSIGPNETAGELEERLAQVGAALLGETLRALSAGKITATPQNSAQSSYASKLQKEEFLIRWDQTAAQIHNLIRALNPAPGAHTFWRGGMLKIWRSALAKDSGGRPGEIYRVGKNEICVGTGAGGLVLLEVQMPGKRPLDAARFLAGHSIQAGERFENGSAPR